MSAAKEQAVSEASYSEAVKEATEAPVEGLIESMENADLDGDFSIKAMTGFFDNCLKTEGVALLDYVNGYRQVYKFLTLLGTVFGWVGSDVWAKIVILQKYIDNQDVSKHYTNVKSMLEYEVENNLIKAKKNDDASGSRTLLRLHRALEYIIGFLRRMDDLQEEEGCATISRTAYEETLMKYHPWVVQKAAKMAMGLLPNKKGLIFKVCPNGDEESIAQARLDFPKAVASMQRAYDTMQEFYSEKDLLNIP